MNCYVAYIFMKIRDFLKAQLLESCEYMRNSAAVNSIINKVRFLTFLVAEKSTKVLSKCL